MRRHRRRKALPTEPVNLQIENLSHEGRGIAHLNGKVVFVQDALPGEQVNALYTSMRDSFDEARAVEILLPSPDRVEPRCPHASICGGCSLQHFDSTAQLAFKQEVLHEKLRHSTGRNDYSRMDAITGPAFGYRRKARLAVRYVTKKEQVLVGFREKNGSFITRMDSCEVLDPQAAGLLPALASLIGKMDAYRHIPQIEVAVGDEIEGSNRVALVFRHLQQLSDMDSEALAVFGMDNLCDIYLQPEGLDSVRCLFPEAGKSRLYYHLPAYELRMAVAGDGALSPSRRNKLATHDEVERFYAHLEEVMQETGFLDPKRPGRLMQRMRRLFARARLEKEEINILRGVLSAVQDKRD